MVTKEDINKLAATLSDITKTLHNATALANGAVEETGKLQEKISALSHEKEKLLAEIEELQKEKVQLTDFLQKTKENLDEKRKEILHELEEELFKKIDSLKYVTNNDKTTLHNERKEETTVKIPTKKEFPNTVKKSLKQPSDAIGDQFKARTSINDTIAKPESAITAVRQPIHDITKAIAINDRFLFTRELFEGNTALFTQTINKLNTMGNLEEAKKYIQTVVKDWDDTSETAQLFLSIVQRRYL
jgi:chromosome segregation ATPase